MGIFDRFFGERNDVVTQPPSMPWDQHPSIYEHVRSNIDSNGKISDKGNKLPDEERINVGSEIRWAAGAMDGVMTHHMGTAEQDQQVKKTINLVLAYCRQPIVKNKFTLYQCIIDDGILSIIDPLIEAIVNNKRIDHQRLYELAHSLVTESPDREPVKFGLVILGLYQLAENEELFQTLGLHDEFTLYCAVALTNSSSDPERSLWKLAQHVDGWGRIHIVERLREAEDPDVKDWLLREGYRNSVMYEYLAYISATSGGLLSALSEEKVGSDLLISAGEILQSLIAGGPAENIDDYEDAATTIEMYLGHLETSAEYLAHFLHVHSIKAYLDDEEADWGSRTGNGWTVERRSILSKACEEILTRAVWKEKVTTALESDDDVEFYEADQTARILNIDPWKHHWRRLIEKPTDSGRWYHASSLATSDRLPELLDLAKTSIDLSKIATGPGSALGMGPGWELHSCLDYLLQELRRFPGQGATFIEAGLQSPVVRHRNMSLNALDEWTKEKWPNSTLNILTKAETIEPDEDVKVRMNKVLNGEPLND